MMNDTGKVLTNGDSFNKEFRNVLFRAEDCDPISD